MRKKREFHTSELIKSLAKIYGFEDILLSFKIKDFFQNYFDTSLFSEIESVRVKNNILTLKIKSPLLKNDFRMRKNFYLKKISEEVDLSLNDIIII